MIKEPKQSRDGGEQPLGQAELLGQTGQRRGLAARLRTYFFAGVLVTAPISITLWLTWRFVTFVDGLVKPWIPPDWLAAIPIGIPGLGLIVAIVVLILIGMFAAGYVGRMLHRLGDRLLNQVPIVRSVYNATKQVFEAVFAERAQAFRETVLIEFPRRNVWAVGFLTGTTSGEVQNVTRATVLNIFVPATPNATTGFLLFVPEEDVRYPDIRIDDGIKLVISSGLVPPAEGNGKAAAKEAQAAEEREAQKRSRFSLMARLRNYLLAGLLVTAPAAITIWLALEFITFVDARVMPQIPGAWSPATYLPFSVPGLGLVLILVGLTLVGMITAGFVGRLIMGSGERLLARVPIVRSIYGATKQIFETVLAQSSEAFRKVVLVEFPRPGSWAIGFLTGDTAAVVEEVAPGDRVNVFLPTTPNPTSGFLIFVPREQIRMLTMSVEDGIKMVVSGGIVTPEAPTEAASPPPGPAPGSAPGPAPDPAEDEAAPRRAGAPGD